MMSIDPERVLPKIGRLIVTRNCPLRCQMCTFWHQWRPDPSLSLIKHWIREFADFGIEDVGIGGGEPFIRKDLPEIVREIKSYGMWCSITTSGFTTGVPFPPADAYEISIHGVKPETHDKIVGVKGCWEKAVNAVKTLNKRCPVTINFVIQSSNYLETVDFCKFAKSLGVKVSLMPVSLKLAAQPCISSNVAEVDPIHLRFLINEAIKVGNVSNSREFFDTFFSKLDKKPDKQPCLAPFNIVLIFANGDVYPCGNVDVPVGNLSEAKKLEDIYQSYKAVREEIRLGSHDRCASCTYPDLVPPRGLQSTLTFLGERALWRLRNLRWLSKAPRARHDSF